eukprot:gene20127-biopygen23538
MDRFASCWNEDLGTFASCLKCIPGGSLGFPTNPAIRSVSLSCCNPTDLPTELSDPWSAPGRGRGLHLVAGRGPAPGLHACVSRVAIKNLAQGKSPRCAFVLVGARCPSPGGGVSAGQLPHGPPQGGGVSWLQQLAKRWIVLQAAATRIWARLRAA